MRNLTRQVTAGADSAAGKAAAIQAYLRSSRFTYSTEPLPGNGYEALENVLLNDRRGYCEQFATSMAMMARIVGIPTRVAVGFLPGRGDGDVYRVGIRNMHAWPELYFARFGWVRFEPTPAAVTSTPSTDPTAAGPSISARPDDAPTLPPTGGEAGSEISSRTILLMAGGGLLAVVTAFPAVVRLRRRSARLATDLAAVDRVEGAWAEIRDTVIDHGESWPGGSPQAIGAEISRRLENAPSVTQIATLVERSRYARSFNDTEATRQLPRLIQDIRQSIAGRAGRRRRILASTFLTPSSTATQGGAPSPAGPASTGPPSWRRPTCRRCRQGLDVKTWLSSGLIQGYRFSFVADQDPELRRKIAKEGRLWTARLCLAGCGNGVGDELCCPRRAGLPDQLGDSRSSAMAVQATAATAALASRTRTS